MILMVQFTWQADTHGGCILIYLLTCVCSHPGCAVNALTSCSDQDTQNDPSGGFVSRVRRIASIMYTHPQLNLENPL